VVAAFDAGAVTSDAGALLLGATDRAIRMMDRLAISFLRLFVLTGIAARDGELGGIAGALAVACHAVMVPPREDLCAVRLETFVNFARSSRLLEMLQIVMAVTDGPCRIGQGDNVRRPFRRFTVPQHPRSRRDRRASNRASCKPREWTARGSFFVAVQRS
jgi:hypothetical protein